MVDTKDLNSFGHKMAVRVQVPLRVRCYILTVRFAEIAQLVEHNLAKVGVAGSSPVFRSCLCPFLW